MFYRESQRELEEKNHEVLDLDGALKERQGELQQRAQLVPNHKHEQDLHYFHVSTTKAWCLSLVGAAGCGH